MCTDSKITENENKKKHTTIKNKKKIIFLLKPRDRVKSVFVSTAPRIRIGQLRCKIPDFTKISKHTQEPKRIMSLPLFYLSNMKYNFFENIINEYINKKTNNKLYKQSCLNYKKEPVFRTNCKIFRCELNTTEETCCCSCNSDAMFEVMKSLYDCYKKKNCNNCNCILCGHLPREERQLGEKRKSEISLVKPDQKDKVKKISTKATVFSIKGKSMKEKELFLKEQALQGKPLPLGKTKSEKELVETVRKAIGLPPEPKSILGKKKYKEAVAAGIIRPLEGKSHSEKEKILREQAALGLPLPEGRSSSERSLIAKVKADAPSLSEIPIPSEKLKQAKAAGLLTPIKGKPQEQKEKILKGLAMHGIPLPEAKSASEKKIIDKISRNLALPPIPDTQAGKEKYKTALASGLITPLEGKTISQKEMILREQAAMGLSLPEGRTKSEKALIEKIKATTPKLSEVRVPSQVLKKAKAAGLLTPLEGKTKEQKENILKGLAMHGVPLPEAKSPSESKIIEKVRADIGLPPEPETPAEKNKYRKAIATGVIVPLEGKSPSEKENILRKQVKMGLTLPEGRTSSEKALIAKVKETTSLPSKLATPSQKLKKAKAAGLLTPLEGKSKDQKEKILKGLAMHGIPLPEAKTASEKKIMDKIIKDVGLPPVPDAPLEKEQYNKALVDGIITPLEGKTSSQKEKILRNQAALGIKLPKARTSSEKALIAKIKASSPKVSKTSKKIMKLDKKTAKVMKESKGPSDECICGILTPPTAKVPAESIGAVRVSSEKIRKAKEAGYLTPLEGKSKQQKEKILKGLAMQGLPLPDANTPSDIELVDNVRQSLGLPPAPKTPSAKQKYNEAVAAGIITPLEGKTLKQKEKILREQAALGLPLPEGRTSSEKSLVAKIKAVAPPPSDIPVLSKKIKKAKATGLLTPLGGKTQEQKENILKGLAMHGIPLPEAKTDSEKKIIDKIRKDVGLPPVPETKSGKEKYKTAIVSGLITPLEGKSTSQKEKVLREQAAMGLSLPEGRTKSEKALIEKIKATTPKLSEVRVPSQVLKKAKAAGLLTPLDGKTKEQKEKILKGLAMHGVPLPEAKSPSESKIIEKVRTDVGLPPEPESPAEKNKYRKAISTGLIAPLEGKSPAEKENILRKQVKMGLTLPEGRTSSEKALIAKVKETTSLPSKLVTPSQKLKKAKAAGLLTPLEGKSKDQKEKILKGLAMHGIPLPEAKTASEKKIMDKIIKDVGLPPVPDAPLEKEQYNKALVDGIITPLEGKTSSQKEKILRNQAALGIKLPKARTSSEKALIAKIKASSPKVSKTSKKIMKLDKKSAKVMKESKGPSDECICGILTPPTAKVPAESIGAVRVSSEKIRKAKEAGYLTPLEGKSKQQKEKILKGLAMQGLPLPDGKTPSDIELVDNVRQSLGLPPAPKTPSAKQKYNEAVAAGIITPLEGKTLKQKEKVLREQAALGLTLPEGRTSSEKSLVAKIKAVAPPPSDIPVLSKKIKKAKAAGLLTPLGGKTHEQKENILKGLAMHGIPLPEAKTNSEKKIIDKIRKDVGLPPVPETKSGKEKYKTAIVSGLITPLEGKTTSQKEKVLREQAAMGLSLPEGRTQSEKALIEKIKATTPKISEVRVPSQVLKKAKAAGLLTPLEGKTKEHKEKILKGLAMHGVPLPEAKSPSERKIIEKVRADIGLPPEPEIPAEKNKYRKAIATGVIVPLEGKSPSEKENILRKQATLGLKLPEGRTKSEKALIEKIKASPRKISEVHVPSEVLKKSKAAGLLTPLEGKTKEQKEKILKGLAMNGVPLPEAKSPSESKIIEKVRADIGLPPEPESPAEKNKYRKAIATGLIAPLEGKSAAEKENILRKQVQMGLTLPEGRTSSEKALIAKVKETTSLPSKLATPSQKLKKAKAAGLLTPLEGKSKDQKEKILKGLAMHGIPLPEAKTASEKKIMDKIIKDVGLPPVPDAPLEKEQYNKALVDGIITPLEGKTSSQKEKILRNQAALGIKLPKGRTSSEKALIAKIQASSPKVSKTSKKIIKLDKKSAKVMKESKGPSDECICGLLTPPTAKVPAESIGAVRVSSEKIRKAKEAGYLTPLEGKSKQQKEKILKGLAMQGLPLPDGKTPSDIELVDNVRQSLGLPPAPKTPSAKQKYNEAVAAGIITPLEGKTLKQKEKVLREQAALGLPLPEGRTSSEKSLVAKIKAVAPPTSDIPVLSKKLKKAKAAGLLTPLEGKTREQKENILKGLAIHGIPMPEGRTSSEKKIVEKIHADLGLPPPPETLSAKEKYQKAYTSGLITPLEGKSSSQKEKILQNLAQIGIALPAGRTPSEKALIAKVKKTPVAPSKVIIPSEKLIKAKAAGLMTPLEGKPPEQKEKILKGLAMQGIPLPEAKTSSEKKIMNKIIKDIGLPPEPETPAEKNKYRKAIAAGLIVPLEGKSPSEKENILRKQATLGLKLPEGRTKSEKALIEKIEATSPKISEVHVPSQVLKKAKAAGLLTPLGGKTKEQKEKILKGLAMHGIPLPEAKSPSENKIIEKVRAEVGLPPEPETPAEKNKYRKAIATGVIVPLEGKSPSEKENILRKQATLGLKLPEGRTKSEKVLIEKIKASPRKISEVRIPSQVLKKAKAEGLLTPLDGKTKDQKEKILKGLAMHGIPLPEAKSPSETKIIEKVRADIGLPPEPETPAEKNKYRKAIATGVIVPLEGKSPSEKENILLKQATLGLKLPEGRTKSEKALIEKIKASPRKISEVRIPSQVLKKAKAEGLLTPLDGKTKEQKEKILKGLAMHGIPLPEAKSPSETKIIEKVRADIGLPPEPETLAEKNKYRKAIATGVIVPLEGKSPSEKENILRKQATLGLKLPEGRTKSEKALIEKIKASPRKISEVRIPSQVLKKAKAAGLLTPLEGKTKEQKEKILRGLAMNGIPLPEAKNSSERKIMNKIRREVGLPPEPITPFEKEQYIKATNNGFITPLEGKTASQKEKVLRNQAALGLNLPEGRTSSEKALIAKIKASTSKVQKSLKAAHTLDKKSAKLMKEGKGPSDECICDLLTSTAATDQLLTSSSGVPSEKIKKAKKAGYLTPLEGKSKEQKEKILKGLAMHGIPLPEAKSKSEKNLMDKIRADIGLPPMPKSSVEKEKYNKALVSGLITPLDGKTASQKEKTLRKQAELGLILPEGRTQSEKSIIQKLKTEYRLPSKAPLISEKDKIRKAKADGLLTPLKGKSAAQKEKIVKGLAKAGLPLPAATTASEKSLIEKVRASVATASKKIKMKSKSKAGITETFEDVIKTTTCDKGCGCDKKKIKFKHSYVKIRVTSPDISSLCPCPDECVPGVKGGVFLDNEGIKVTVGRATAITVFSSKEITQKREVSSLMTFNTSGSTFENIHNKKLCPIFTKNISDTRLHDSINNTRTMIETVKSITSDTIVNNSKYKNTSSGSSFDSRFFIETESSLGLITPSETMSNISLLMTDTSYEFNLNQHVSTRDKNVTKTEVIHKKDRSMSEMCEIYLKNNVSSLSTVNSQYSNMLLKKLNQDVYALETTQSEIQEQQKDCFENLTVKSSIDENLQINEISRLVNRIITTELSARSSSFIILIPTSSDDISESSQSNISSSICIQVSKNYSSWCPIKSELSSEPCVMCSSTRGRENIRSRIRSTDTTQDRPCCCNDLQNIEAQNSCRRKKISFSSTPPGNRGLCLSSTNRHSECSLPKSPILNRPGKCKITKMEFVKQTISVACGPDESFYINQRPKTVIIKSESPCNSCVKFDVDENEKSSKPSNLCSCQGDPLENKTYKTPRTAKKSKNIICECPEEPPEELEPQVLNDEYLKLIKSELTQTTSGFKLDISPKVKSEMSFEDVLKYYYQQMEKEVESDKKKSRTSKRNKCECPEIVPDETELIHNERFKGIKIHIEGKGSGSRGLNGILCFELFEYAGSSHQ